MSIEDYIIKTGSHKGRLNQNLLKTGKPKGYFQKWDKHPSINGLVYLNWNSAMGYERWYTIEDLKKFDENKSKYMANPEVRKRKNLKDREYQKQNIELINVKRKERRIRERGKINEQKRIWRRQNREKINESRKIAYAEGRVPKSPLHQIQHIYDWNKTPNVKALKHIHKKKGQLERSNKYLSKPSNRIAHSFRGSIWKALQGKVKRSSSISYLGCSIEEFRIHLENLWTDNMNWDNYGRGGWHIDHIKPCSWFDLNDEKQIKECFNWKNLQPLWESDNCAKKDRWEG